MDKKRCELCNCVLKPEITLSGGEVSRFGQICRNCLDELMKYDAYAYDEYAHMLTPEKNDFSFWFPKIEHCGLNVPKSLIFHVPEHIQKHFFLEGEDDYEV